MIWIRSISALITLEAMEIVFFMLLLISSLMAKYRHLLVIKGHWVFHVTIVLLGNKL